MALHLVDAAKLSDDVLVKGVIEQVVKASPLAKQIPFVELNGNALAINIEDENNQPTVQFYAPNDTWEESTGKTDQKAFTLTILGGDADVDRFIQKTRSNINDQMAVQVAMKSKAMAHTFDQAAIYGVAQGSKEFNGLHWYVDNFGCPQFHMGTGTTGAALSMYTLDEAIDAMPESPDFLLLSKTMRRRINWYLKKNGSYAEERDRWGDYVETYRGIPMVVSDWLLQTEAIADGAYDAKTGGNTTSIFIVKTGEEEGLVGLQNGGIQKEVFPKLEAKNAMRTRLVWYVALALYKRLSLVRIDGITDAAVTD